MTGHEASRLLLTRKVSSMEKKSQTGIQSGASMNSAIIVAAGQGSRMNTEIPKQYLDLCGMPVLAWSLKAFQEFDPVGQIILVTAADDIDYCQSEIVDRYGFRKVSRIVPGGAERYLSVWEGLKAAKETVDTACQESGVMESGPVVFIHDGARPMIDRPILERTLKCAEECRACVAGMSVKDTIKIVDEAGYAVRTPDRSKLWQIQTPQVFLFPLVYEAYRTLIRGGIRDVTDDAMVVERMTNVRVRLVEGSYRNLKITTPEDIAMAASLFDSTKI